jgi:hypothetical protein
MPSVMSVAPDDSLYMLVSPPTLFQRKERSDRAPYACGSYPMLGTPMAVGLYRTPENWVAVDHGTHRALMQWDTHRPVGFEPRFERLPMEVEGSAGHRSASTAEREPTSAGEPRLGATLR